LVPDFDGFERGASTDIFLKDDVCFFVQTKGLGSALCFVRKVFVVEEREGEGKDENAFWTRVGSAWSHKDGKGYNIVLSALPLNGRLVLREFSEDDDKADDGKRTVQRVDFKKR